MSLNSNPATSAAAVTPSDSTVFGEVTRALHVGTAGNIKVVMHNGDTVTINAVVAGSILPICVRKVFSTDTTASNITRFW